MALSQLSHERYPAKSTLDCTNTSRNFPSDDANIFCPCSIEMPLRLVSAGESSRLNGSKARRAMSIGDMDVVRTSFVWARTDFSLSGVNRLVIAPNISGG